MPETIYTIPINEAFDEALEKEKPTCPFCKLESDLETNELDIILGASMMEPDIRIKTNEKGFCGKHFHMLRTRKNRLGLGLIMESHLDEVKKSIKPGGFLARDKSAAPKKNAPAILSSSPSLTMALEVSMHPMECATTTTCSCVQQTRATSSSTCRSSFLRLVRAKSRAVPP